MRLLPSQQASRVEAAIKTLHQTGRLTVEEPCDCNGQIRHNNGGNYHAVTEFRLDTGEWFARFGSTSEYDDSEWERIGLPEIEEYIRKHADWL